MDRAIAYTMAARLLQIVGSAGTVLLIVHFLTPVEQGYYYTLLSLVALQTIFELGFSFVILQLAAHESVHLTFGPHGEIDGDPVAHSRLASVLQNAIRWYSMASAALVAVLLPLGFVFFSRHSTSHGDVAWQVPWAASVLAVVVLFFLNPVFSFLEGCGQVRQVAMMRLGQSVASVVLPWMALVSGYGLYSPCAVYAGYSSVGLYFLFSRRRFLISLLRHRTQETISWSTEVWPFQWKTAISFLSSYFAVQLFTPVLFSYWGPVDAGRIGMSLSVAGYLWAVVIPWTSTKASSFGNMIARGEVEDLDRLFFRTLKQSLAAFAIVAMLCMAGLVIIQRFLPSLALRMVPLNIFVLLLLTSMCMLVVQSQAIYLRAHKSEPFMGVLLTVAALASVCALVVVRRWGVVGAAWTHLCCNGIVGIFLATAVFRSKRVLRDRLREVGSA